MSVVRYYSDPHFHHEKMAIKRSFKDENEMNEYIIQEWNKVVSKKECEKFMNIVEQYIHENLKYKTLSEALLIYKNNLSPEKLNRRWKKNR